MHSYCKKKPWFIFLLSGFLLQYSYSQKISESVRIDPLKNKIDFGTTNKLNDWVTDFNDQGKVIEKIKLMLKNYLELDNVSFIFGTGTSIHLGAVSIRNFPIEIENT